MPRDDDAMSPHCRDGAQQKPRVLTLQRIVGEILRGFSKQNGKGMKDPFVFVFPWLANGGDATKFVPVPVIIQNVPSGADGDLYFFGRFDA